MSAATLWPIFWMVVAVCVTIAYIMKHLQRTKRIKESGWPPEHLNADGEFVEPFWNRKSDDA